MVSWLSVELSKLECVSLTTLLDPRDSWVIDDKQPLTPTCNILLMLITVDSKSISKRVHSKHKRARATTVKNLSVEDCFLIVDHIIEKDKFSDSGVNENFYEVLSKSGLTAIDPTNSLFKIKSLQLADTMGVLEGGSNVHVLTKDDNHLIQMVDSCPQCLSSNTLLNTAVHMCREIPLSNGATTIIASSSFEREFDMESFHE